MESCQVNYRKPSWIWISDKSYFFCYKYISWNIGNMIILENYSLFIWNEKLTGILCFYLLNLGSLLLSHSRKISIRPLGYMHLNSLLLLLLLSRFRPHRGQRTRLPCPWDSPGKNTGVSCHFLLQSMKVKSESEVAQSCLTLSDTMDCSPPGSSVLGIFQARVLEWGDFAFSKILLVRPKQ